MGESESKYVAERIPKGRKFGVGAGNDHQKPIMKPHRGPPLLDSSLRSRLPRSRGRVVPCAWRSLF